ncbi:MAG: hypothetical protein VX223_04645, partial [Myxococcota bacterium]|nr:hypothetical protein [Myxococcota bacterium]
TSGRVFIAQPPLYRITTGKKKQKDYYAWTDGELQALLGKSDFKGKATVQRFKGLGEMVPKQLWDTTMNPDTRTMVRVDIQEAAAAEKAVTVLMGDGAEARRNWIVDNVAFGLEDEADTEVAA